MNKTETRAVSSLALLYAMRMLGLFMVLPIFSIYGKDLTGASSVLIGLAVGVYGLSQAVLQIPFGAMSDRFGRKPLIFAGLILFFIGSVVAALSDHIYGVILGRFLQGAGAISAVLMATVGDLTREESRTKAMAFVGMSIGVSFSLALVIGPLIADSGGLSGIFWVTALMAIFGIGVLIFLVPSPQTAFKHRDSGLFLDQIRAVLKRRELLRLDAGIFFLHLAVTAMFLAIPISLSESSGLAVGKHWMVYLSVLLLSFVAMVPLIIIGEKKAKMKSIFLIAISLILVSSVASALVDGVLSVFWFTLFVFFMGFNLLEASLPSLVTKVSPAGSRGTAMGVYSTSQFLGAFVGGVVAGLIMSEWGVSAIYYFVAAVTALWVLVAAGMKNPSLETNMVLSFESPYSESFAQKIEQTLSGIVGVSDVLAQPGERYAYLKLDKLTVNAEQVEMLATQLKEEARILA